MKELFFILMVDIPCFCANAQTSNTFNSSKVDTFDNKSKNEVVYTPAGATFESKVNFIDSKHHLNIQYHHVQLINTKTGKVDKEFDNVLKENSNENLISNLNSKISKSIEPEDDGWITYAYWNNLGNKPISYFSTNWIVPSSPTTNSTQTIFLFNCVENILHGTSGTYYILQPVLQWGKSAAGGGNYWSVTNWCICNVDGQISEVFHGSLIKVNPGTKLQGVIKLLSDSNNTYCYNSSFTEYSDSALQVSNLTRANWAYETLEVYHISECTEYPVDTIVKMTGINIKTDSIYPSLIWTPVDTVTECGQHSLIVSNSSDGGEVDIYFHGSPASILDISTKHKIFIYTSVASGNITVNIPEKATIEILNAQGQIIKAILTYSNKTNIDVSALSSGLYFAEVITEKGIVTKKFVKE